MGHEDGYDSTILGTVIPAVGGVIDREEMALMGALTTYVSVHCRSLDVDEHPVGIQAFKYIVVAN